MTLEMVKLSPQRKNSTKYSLAKAAESYIIFQSYNGFFLCAFFLRINMVKYLGDVVQYQKDAKIVTGCVGSCNSKGISVLMK
jgi:hypothetical protein